MSVKTAAQFLLSRRRFFRMRSMSPEGPRWSKLAEFMSHHAFGNENRYKLFAVMHGKRMPDKLWCNGATTRPCLNRPMLPGPIQTLYLL
jgi:hypothetical protein